MRLLAICILLTIYFNLQGQSTNLDVFMIQYQGEKIEISQDINSRYLGTYKHNDEDDPEFSWEIVLELDGGYFWKKTRIQVGEIIYYKWVESDRIAIEWGAIAEDGSIKEFVVKDYRKNSSNTDTAFAILLEMKTETRRMFLYEKQGEIRLYNGKKEIYIDRVNAILTGR